MACIILTIDVEEYFQVENFTPFIARDRWGEQTSRLSIQMEKIFKILDEKKARATFFVLGWIAERHKVVIKRMLSMGHEVACHGYGHKLIYTQSRDEFREDIRKSKQILEDIIQGPVAGYRAPSFSVTENSMWALDILLEEGFAYDSSVFPIHRDRGGIPGANRFPYKINGRQRSLWEVPISTGRWFNQNIPYAGGGYFRFLPYWVIKHAVKSLNREGHPAIMYLHPWELDPDQPRVHQASRLAKFRHYYQLEKTEMKLKKLLSDFRFGSIREVFWSKKTKHYEITPQTGFHKTRLS